MSKQNIRRTWPLYLAIAVAGAASIATTYVPNWSAQQRFEGPRLRLDQTRAADIAPFTIELSSEYGDPTLEVTGVLTYELDGAPQDVRVALVEPGQSVRTAQTHRLEGTGRIELSMVERAQLSCEPDAGVCKQTLAVAIDVEGLLTGAIDLRWYLSVDAYGNTPEMPDDVHFEVAVEGGTPIEDISWPDVFVLPTDEPGDGRWFLYEQLDTLFQLRPLGDVSRHFTMRGAGGFTSSQLSVRIDLYNHLPATTTSRLTLIPDQPATSPVVERVVTLTGGHHTTTFELPILEPLDCPPGPACERGFTLTLDTEGDNVSDIDASVAVDALIQGEGEQPPADAQVVLTIDPADPI